MRKEQSLLRHLLENIFWMLVSIVVCKHTLFVCMERMSYEDSERIFHTVMICSVIVGMIVNREQKNRFTALTNSVFGIQIYIFLSYESVHVDLGKYFLVFFGALLVFLVPITLYRALRNNRAGEALAVLHNAVHRLYYTVMIILCIPMLCISARFVVDDVIFASSVPASVSSEDLFEEHRETLLLLEEEAWSALRPEEKLDVLQVVANIQRQRFGISHELNVVASALEKNVGANYDVSRHRINIGTQLLTYATAKQAVFSTIHECRHAYQHELVALYESADEEMKNLQVFRETHVETIIYEINHYINVNDNFEAYDNQYVERDADLHAELEWEMYDAWLERN